jgi:hypothetical protein
MDRIDQAQDGNQLRALVNTVMNLCVRKMLEILEGLHTWRLLKKGSAPCS